jgi:hypothetical protein
MISLFMTYLFINIRDLGKGSPGLLFLGSSASIGALMLLLQILFSNKIYFRVSFFVVILFFTYFIFRMVIDTQDLYLLKAYTIATNGGSILYYIFGVLIGTLFFNIKAIIASSKQAESIYIFCIIILTIIFSLFFIDILFNTLSLSRSDIFLVAGGTNYQRVGSFLLISFFILSFFIMLAFINYKKKNIFTRFLLLIFSIYYLGLMISALWFSQLIGSNNAFVNLIVVLTSSVIIMSFIFSNKGVFILTNYDIKYKNIFTSKIARHLYYKIFISIILISMFSVFMIMYWDIDIDKFRIFGFGTEGMTSVNSRLALWDNFYIHLDYSLPMGNMAVDTYTTGLGSYTHSLIATLLTHLGLFGFLLFFTYLYFAIKENMTSNSNDYQRFMDNSIFIYSFMMFAGIFLVASVATFFTWTPLWFLMGMIFPPFKFIYRGSKHCIKK